MSKIIKLKESDIKKIVKRVLKEQGDIRGTNLEEIVMNERKLNEQPIDMACKSCVGKALGSKYSSKVEKAMMVLMSGKTPTMGDLTELLSDVDIMDGMVIGPKLLECVEFCSKPDFKGSPRMPKM